VLPLDQTDPELNSIDSSGMKKLEVVVDETGGNLVGTAPLHIVSKKATEQGGGTRNKASEPTRVALAEVNPVDRFFLKVNERISAAQGGNFPTPAIP
jgi:hypothetical protein